LDLLEQGRVDQVWEKIGDQFRAFIGGTASEEICRERVWRQAERGKLPFKPEHVGSHWGGGVQIDVAVANWAERWLLVGERKWGMDWNSAQVVRGFEETAKRLAEIEFEGWSLHLTFFVRGGFTDAARSEAQGIELVELQHCKSEWSKRQPEGTQSVSS
jgi:hypothetical protein